MIHPVNEYPGHVKLLVLGFRHVFAAYAGAVAVPLFMGWALVDAGCISPPDIPHLIAADLPVAGIATIVQSDCTFSAAIPIATIGSRYDVLAIYGSVIASGVFMMSFAPLFVSLLRLFPPLVTGMVLLVIDTTLMPVAADWVGGGAEVEDIPDFGTSQNLAVAAFVLVLILSIEHWAPEWLARIAVLVGIISGLLLCIPLGMVDRSGTKDSPIFGPTHPFYFGTLEFVFSAVSATCIVSLVIMIEATGDILTIGEITETEVDNHRTADALRADGAATVIGGIFNTSQCTVFAQDIGVLSITGVRSRWVTAAAGGMLLILGLVPKTVTLVAVIPAPVLGDASIALFGVVAASGVRTLSKVRFTESNIIVVDIPLALALFPAVLSELFVGLPPWAQTFMASGICVGSVAAIVLNLLFDAADRAPYAVAPTAHGTFRGGVDFEDKDHDDYDSVPPAKPSSNN